LSLNDPNAKSLRLLKPSCQLRLGIALCLAPACSIAPQDSASVRRVRNDSVYVPMTFGEYARGMIGPRTALRAVALAGFDQWRRQPRAFPSTWHGFEERLGVRYGQVAISHTLRFAASRKFDERILRYRPCACGDSASRLWRAITGPYRVTSPEGIHYSVLNPVTELLSGVLATGVRSSGLHVGEGLRGGATGLVAESLIDVAREYWPWRWRPPFF
jgi:hypothetical protein